MSQAQKLATRWEGLPLRKTTARTRDVAPQTTVQTVTSGMNQKSVRSFGQSIAFNLETSFYREAAAAPGASMVLPKIIFPAVVWRTLVTVTSTFFPRSFRALSTTTMVPSSR